MAKLQRPFNPEALAPFAVVSVRCPIGADSLMIWRYTVLVPVQEELPDGTSREIASAVDLNRLERMLADHFGGFSTPNAMPGYRGFGARDPLLPQQSRESNLQAALIVYAAACGASDRYFLALRRELEDALGEGVILIERQDVTII